MTIQDGIHRGSRWRGQLAVSDAEIVALDARTGRLFWKTVVADPKLGYGYTSGPIVVRGKVIAGMTGCSRYKDDVCFISGDDAAPERSSGGRRPSPARASPATTYGAICPSRSAPEAMPGFPGATTRRRFSSIGARRSRNRGHGRFAAPTARRRRLGKQPDDGLPRRWAKNALHSVNQPRARP
jgi:hypothetical protein